MYSWNVDAESTSSVNSLGWCYSWIGGTVSSEELTKQRFISVVVVDCGSLLNSHLIPKIDYLPGQVDYTDLNISKKSLLHLRTAYSR